MHDILKAMFDFCFRLKEIIFKERNSKVQLEVMVHRLQSEVKKLTIELIKARDRSHSALLVYLSSRLLKASQAFILFHL